MEEEIKYLYKANKGLKITGNSYDSPKKQKQKTNNPPKMCCERFQTTYSIVRLKIYIFAYRERILSLPVAASPPQ